MKRALLTLGLFAIIALMPTAIPSQQSDILCCRQVCPACGDPDNNLCDFQSVEHCDELDGWEVIDCIECHGPKPNR